MRVTLPFPTVTSNPTRCSTCAPLRALADLGLARETSAAEAMSPNVEIVRQIEFHMPSNWPEDPIYRGHAGLRRAEVGSSFVMHSEDCLQSVRVAERMVSFL